MHVVRAAGDGGDERALEPDEPAHAMPRPGLDAAAGEDQPARRDEDLSRRIHLGGERRRGDEMTHVVADHAVLRVHDRHGLCPAREQLFEAFQHFFLPFEIIGRSAGAGQLRPKRGDGLGGHGVGRRVRLVPPRFLVIGRG